MIARLRAARVRRVALLALAASSAQDPTPRAGCRRRACRSASASGSSTTSRFGKIHVGTGDMEVLPMDTVRGRDDLAHRLPAQRRHSVLPRQRPVRGLDRRAHARRRSATGRTSTKAATSRSATTRSSRTRASTSRTTSRRSRASSIRSTTARSSISCARFRCASAWTRRFNDYFMRRSQSGALQGRCGASTIEVPAGRVRRDRHPADHQVEGIFSEGGHAEVWLSDDDEPHHAADEVEA